MDQSMTESTTLLNAQIGFLDTHVALIHVSLQAYPLFVQAISQLLLHNSIRGDDGNPIYPARPWQYWHPFVNVSITSTECTVVCPRREADELFAPIVAALNTTLARQVSISVEDFSVILIGGEGLEAGQRVLDLTTPLAMAGICIFFITSYWSDFILVPFSARAKVIHALEERGFVFEADGTDTEAGHMTNPASPLLQSGHHSTSSSSSFDFMPGTPPPSSLSELQTRTFALLKKHHVTPRIDPNVHELVTCAGIKFPTTANGSAHSTNDPHNESPVQSSLHLGLLRILTAPKPPHFLSLTLTDTESISLTLETSILSSFPHSGEDLLLGKDGPFQIPITFDLRDLPLESTGIVCGVASRVSEGMRGRLLARSLSAGAGVMGEMFNLSYLSTARAGHVIVYEDELADVWECLEGER